MTRKPASAKPTAVITGAAGAIGLATAKMLEQQGYTLALADIKAEALDRAMAALGPGHIAVPTDISDLEQVRALGHRVLHAFGRVDVLINNAGTVIIEPFAECPVEKLEREHNVNYLGALYCTKQFLPPMLEAGTGHIVSVASLAGILPLGVSAGYTASKFALRGLMLSLHLALKPNGICVSCVCPTAIDTPLLHYEALNGGSALNFLQTPLEPEAVAGAIWKAIAQNKMEICVPGHEGVAAKLAAFFPRVLPRLLPWLEKIGERNRVKFVARKGLQQASDPLLWRQ